MEELSTKSLNGSVMDAVGKRWRYYCTLLKPRILLMVLLTSAIGFFLGARVEERSHDFHYFVDLLLTLVGTALSCGGASTLNHYLERDVDAKMQRTSARPLPKGLIVPGDALLFGVILILSGITLLVGAVNLLTGYLALLTCFLYVLVYTPLKRVTWLNTFVGAIPGALPPVGGWTAATGSLHVGAWVLFLIMFLWQHPHFYSIAWLYREDYARGGLKMLPVVDEDGNRTVRQVIYYLLLLIPASLFPTLFGISGDLYFYGALLLGLSMLFAGLVFAIKRSSPSARRLLRASLLYLPLLFVLILLDVKF